MCTAHVSQRKGGFMAIEGCTDESACNYDPFAVVDNGNCNLPACLNPEACNYDTDATCDGGLEACLMPSCTDPLACNFNPEGTCGEGECHYGEIGCDDPSVCNYVADTGCVSSTSCDYSCCPGPGCCGLGMVWSSVEGKCQISPNCRYDFDLSGHVNLTDFLEFLSHFDDYCTQ